MCTLRSPLAALAVLAAGPALAQDADQIHPRTMLSVGFGIGDDTLEFNTGSLATGVVTSSADSFRFRGRAEHYFRTDFGIFVDGYFGTADDIAEDLGSADSSLDSLGLFVAAAYRATMDDDFRLPVRFGPFLQSIELDDSALPDGAIEYTTIGVRLSAEPEYIIMQRNESGRIAELSAFAEISCGAGPTKVEDDVSSEDGYAFTLAYELGLRYRFGMGLLASLSWYSQKYHIGTTESYETAVFSGVDEDWSGIMIGLGWRF